MNGDRHTWGAPDQLREDLLEVKLLAQIAQGDAEAFTNFYSRTSDISYTTALSILRDASLAEDVLQEVYTQIWKNSKAYKAPFRVFQKLMPRVLKQARTMDASIIPDGLKFVENDNSGWMTLPIPGVHFKLLSLDHSKDYAVVLARLDPGATYPAHLHFGSEENLHAHGRFMDRKSATLGR